jgi:glucosamine-6-phosphate deaminase
VRETIVLGTELEFARAGVGIVADAGRSRTQPAIALPSGSTPKPLYRELSRAANIDALEATTVFAVDELLGVPRSHPATNASYFRATPRFPVAALHILTSDTSDPEEECARFARLIHSVGGLDLAVLGIGINGHLAFNEPGSPFDSRTRRVRLAQSTREAYAEWFSTPEGTPGEGMTLGLADLIDARQVLLLARGSDKAVVLQQALQGPVTQDVPASILQRHRRLTVLCDSDAAALLQSNR